MSSNPYYAVCLQHSCGSMINDPLCDIKWLTTDYEIAQDVCAWLKQHPPIKKIRSQCNYTGRVCNKFTIETVSDLPRLKCWLPPNLIILEPIYENYYYHEGIINEFISSYDREEVTQYQSTPKYVQFMIRVRSYARELENKYSRSEILLSI